MPAAPLANRLLEGIDAARGLYHRLVLLVGPAGSGKTGALREVSASTFAPLVNVDLIPRRSEARSEAPSLRGISSEARSRSTGLPWTVTYTFSDASQVPDNKRIFEEMLAASDRENPGRGPLLVVDELLNYPHARKDVRVRRRRSAYARRPVNSRV